MRIVFKVLENSSRSFLRTRRQRLALACFWRVELVVDAIGPVTEEGGGRLAIEEMLAVDIQLVTTDEVCSQARQTASAGSFIPPA